MTAVAYQGLGSLDPVLERARAAGKGVFVLAATSNPESRETQSARSWATSSATHRSIHSAPPPLNNPLSPKAGEAGRA